MTSVSLGTGQNVKVHTPGAVVTTTDVLMTVVPDGTGIEVEAQVGNGDIGFVREGQKVAVKLPLHLLRPAEGPRPQARPRRGADGTGRRYRSDVLGALHEGFA